MKARFCESLNPDTVTVGTAGKPSSLAASRVAWPFSTNPFSSIRIGTMCPKAAMLFAIFWIWRLGCTRAFRLLICSEPGARYVISSGRLAGTAAMRGFFDMCALKRSRKGAVEGTKNDT